MAAINYDKHPLTIEAMLDRVAEAVKDFPKAALFELAERGYDSAFEILTACIISIRTRDEVTVPTAERLFAKARTPRDVARLSVDEIDHCIGDSTFHHNKARQIQAIAADVAKTHGGSLPCDFETLTGYPGVGPKCANLTLGIACGMPTGVGVDIHVHRVTNRWGLVAANTPEKTMAVLNRSLAPSNRVRINALLVPFGKHICTGTRPKCSHCPVRDHCRQVGVVNPR